MARGPVDAPGARRRRRRLHPDATGGAILLGLRSIAVVARGSAGADGIANAIRLAARSVEVDAIRRTAARSGGGAGRGSLGHPAARIRRTLGFVRWIAMRF